MNKIFSFIILSLAAMLAFSACVQEKIEVPSTGVTISPATLTMLDGDWKELTATITPGDVSSSFLVWASSDTKVVVVDQWGRVSAMWPGKATITATNGAYSGKCEITVEPVKETGITLEKTTMKMIEEDTGSLEYLLTPRNATYQDSVKWTSSNPEVAKVKKDTGEIEAMGIGTAVITATTYYGKTATCTVTVEANIPTEPETSEYWRPDKAGYRAVLGGDVDVTSDFLTYSASEGVIKWDENTTGKPRTATIVTGSSTVTITQFDPKDFAGNWKIKAQIFAPNKNLGVTAGTNKEIPLTIAPLDEKKATTAVDGSETITNNLAISGLINSYVAEAAVVINYAKKSYRFGIFFNGKKAQAVETGKPGFNYVALLPELGNGWGTYNFVPVPFNGEQNLGWLWFVADDLNTMHYGEADWYKMPMISGEETVERDILGLSFVACKGSTPTKDDYTSVNGSSGYDVIYQCNPNKPAKDPFVLKRQ